ncbi:MAG: TetR/AcrR family transcriptional regulator [Anaerofustis sp.]
MPKETFLRLPEQKQETVMRAAIGEFMRCGFEKANVGTIAKNAEIAKGSIYQYFENKEELFRYALEWAVRFFATEYGQQYSRSVTDLFEFFRESAEPMMRQIQTEYELAVFVQEVFLGHYNNVARDLTEVMLRSVDGIMLGMIRQGKENGSIRCDISDELLVKFMEGASMRLKEDILRRAKEEGNSAFQNGFAEYETEMNALIELLKNGMGAKE